MTKTAPNSCATAFIIRAINNRPHHHVARSAARAREDRKDDVQDVCVFVEYAHGRARHTWRRNPLGGARGASVGYGMCACRGQARVAADALPLPHVVRVAMPCGHLRCARRGAAASDLRERPAAAAPKAPHTSGRRESRRRQASGMRCELRSARRCPTRMSQSCCGSMAMTRRGQ